MGFTSGNVTFQRYAVVGSAPAAIDQAVLDQLAAHALTVADLGIPEEIEYGWCGPRHIDDRRFTFENCVYSDCLYVALRLDTNKVPAEILKAMKETEEETVAAGNPSGFISKSQKRDVKDTIRRQTEDQLRSGKFRRSKLVPILWDLKANVLYGPTSAMAFEKLAELFERTFKLSLTRMTAGRQGLVIAEAAGQRREYEDARPTPFTRPPNGGEMWPEYPWCAKGPEPKDFFGNEWLMSLWYLAETNGHAADGIEVAMAGGVLLECAFDSGTRDTLKGEIRSIPESRMALQSGKVPREAGLMLAKGEGFTFRLKAETLAISALALPEVEDADTARVVFETRIEHLREFSGLLDGSFVYFMAGRLSDKWATKAVPKLTAWIAGDKTDRSGAPETAKASVDSSKKMHVSGVSEPETVRQETTVEVTAGQVTPENSEMVEALTKGAERVIADTPFHSVKIDMPDGTKVKVSKAAKPTPEVTPAITLAEGKKEIRTDCLALETMPGSNGKFYYAFAIRALRKGNRSVYASVDEGHDTREAAAEAGILAALAELAKFDADRTPEDMSKILKLHKEIDKLRATIAIRTKTAAPEPLVATGPKAKLKRGRDVILTGADAGSGSAMAAGA